MITYTIKGVPPHAIKVTADKDLFDAPADNYAVLDARLDVEVLRSLEVDTDDPELLESDTVARTKNTKISLEPNPRTQNLKTPVAKAIKASLLRRDGHFHHLNRGVLLTAGTFNYDNKTKTLTWSEEDPLVHGDLDGAHTLRIIDETVGTKEWHEAAKGKKPRKQFVGLQIVRGVPFSEIPKIAEGRNSSVNVEAFALEELAQSFEFIKGKLEEYPGLREMVAFKQNEIRNDGKEMDVVYILQLLTLLDNVEFDGDDQPYMAYWSRKKTVNQFIERRENYHRLENLIVDALGLKEYIVANFELWYNTTDGKTGTQKPRFRRTNECENGKTTSFVVLPLIMDGQPTEIDYALSSEGLAMPILAALRTIVSHDELADWTQDPYDLLDEIGPVLVDALTDALAANRNPVVTLKRKGVWSALYDKARIHLFEAERKKKRSGRKRSR